MTEPQPTTSQTPVIPPPPSGVFGTKIPSTVAFAIGILLFFTPFLEIRCNSMTIQSVSGVQLATGFKVDTNKGNPGYFSDLDNSSEIKNERKVDRQSPNRYAMLALIFATLGLIVSFTKWHPRVSSTTATIVGFATTACLFGLWMDIGKQVKLQLPKSEDGLSISVGMTSWFYVTLIVFVAATFFSFKRLQIVKSP